MRLIKSFVLCAAAGLSGCATEPPRYGEVLILKPGQAQSESGYPAPGTVWRLDERDLNALSPAPIVPAPPPPKRAPPPRPNDPPPAYYGPPPYGYY